MFKRNPRWIATLLVLGTCLGVAMAGCNRDSGKSDQGSKNPSDKAKPLIGVSLLTLTNPFFKEIADKLQSEGDRKSTRLNSSHEWISYAVFCLKKKKKKKKKETKIQQIQ